MKHCQALIFLAMFFNSAQVSLGAGALDDNPQGEYSGIRGNTLIGIQVVKKEGNTFEAIYYPKGLPGAGGQEDRTSIRRVKGISGDDRLSFNFGSWSAVWQHDRLDLRSVSEGLTHLQRIFRTSSDMGAEPPDGAVVLFKDGKIKALENGQLEDNEILLPGCASRTHFKAFIMHLEFRAGDSLPVVPGGVFLQDRYEIRLMNSFGATGLHRDCGGIPGISAPRLNACFPPFAWQTLQITFFPAVFDDFGKKVRFARLSANLNGVSIHEELHLSKTTRGAPKEEGNSSGPIRFIGNRNELGFRNVWVLPLTNPPR
jgi:hypothetical protein